MTAEDMADAALAGLDLGELRDRVLEAAAALFRERGFGGVGVVELMNAAGLTHGGFYGQFESKEDLTSGRFSAMLSMAKRLGFRARKSPDSALLTLLELPPAASQ